MDSMTKAKTRMLLNHPFFAVLLLKQKVLIDPQTETASVDGVYLRYNQEWFDTLDTSEQLFLLAHEVMHLAFLHHLRRGNRNPKKWNMACDYAINQILVDAGLKMPKDGLLNPGYRNMSAEEIYDILPQGQNQGQGDPEDQDEGSTEDQGQGGQGLSGFGDVLDFPDAQNSTQEALQQENALVEAAKAVEGRAYLPDALKRIVNELLNPSIEWYDALEKLRSERSNDDYSYRRGNRNYMAQGIFMPTLENLTYGNAVIAVDTSGSITQGMLNQMIADAVNVSDIIDNKLFIIYSDDKVRSVSEFEPGDQIVGSDIRMLGGGGTDFIPAFEYVEEQDLRPKLLLYFTDGYCDSFPEEPEYDVIWLCNGRKDFNPPFGEVIQF